MRKVLGVALLLLVVCPFMVFARGSSEGSGVITIAMMPKFRGENYFDAVRIGAEEAVAELNRNGRVVDFLYDGPPQDQATNQRQVDILEGWIAQRVDAILVSPNDPNAIAPTLQRARDRGIKVLTFDADAREDSRDLFVNQVVAAGVADGLVRGTAQKLQEKGYGPSNPANLAMVSSARTDANQQSWVAEINRLLATSQYSWIVLRNVDTDIYFPGPDETTTQAQSGTLIGRMGPGANQIQAAIGLTSMATPALGSQYQAAAQKPDHNRIVLTGLATPNAIRAYIMDSTNPMDAGVIWDCMDLGYLSIQAAYQLATNAITTATRNFNAGRLGSRDIENGMIVLGPALVFDVNNVGRYDY